MSEKRFTIKPQDDYWAVVDNYNEDKVCIINGIHTEIEAEWLCDFMNEQQATIRKLQDLCGESDGENAKLRIENKKLKERNAHNFAKKMQLMKEIKELKAKLREKEEDEQLYANEIVELRKTNEEWLQFKDLGGDY